MNKSAGNPKHSTAQPAVSVLVPTYNRSRLLAESVASILSQTHTDLELWVCDNASTDATAEVVASFEDPRLRFRPNRSPLGLAATMAEALPATRGRYIAFLCDDDWWHPRFLERLLRALEAEPEAALSFCDHWVTGPEGEVLEEATRRWSKRFGRDRLAPGLHRDCRALALRDQSIGFSAALLRRQALEETAAVDGLAGLTLDYYMYGRLALAGRAAVYLPERLAYYRHLEGSASRSLELAAELWRDLQRCCAALYPSAGPPARAHIRRKWALAVFGEQAALRRSGRRGEMPRALKRALRSVPAAGRPDVARLAAGQAARQGVAGVAARARFWLAR